jgi:ribosome maturation factor RimP
LSRYYEPFQLRFPTLPAKLSGLASSAGPEWGRPLFFLEAELGRQEGTLERVRSVATRVTADLRFELVDVEIKRAGGGQLVRLYVDKPGGIGLDELSSVSEEVSAVLDAEDPIDGHYTLEVSSPGLDRPLKTEADYRRFAGSLARVSSYEPVDGRRHWTGRIVSCEAGVVTLDLEREKSAARVPLARISHGRLEVEFPKKAKAE